MNAGWLATLIIGEFAMSWLGGFFMARTYKSRPRCRSVFRGERCVLGWRHEGWHECEVPGAEGWS